MPREIKITVPDAIADTLDAYVAAMNARVSDDAHETVESILERIVFMSVCNPGFDAVFAMLKDESAASVEVALEAIEAVQAEQREPLERLLAAKENRS